MTAHAAIGPLPDGSGGGANAFGPLGQALADELVRASCLLGDLAYDLGSESETLRRHMASLQEIDRVTQIQLAIADLLRGGSIEEGIAGITLEDVKARLQSATGEK